MSIITISRGTYSGGKQVAEKVAQKLGYEVIARDVLIEASKEFNIPEIKLVRAIHDAPSVLDRFTYGKEKYVAFIQSAILTHLEKGNVVYHGLAGHFFARDISHVLRVRIIADMEDRVKLEMEREGISAKEALQILKKDDEERRKWGRHLYGIDTNDPSLYDLVIHIKKIKVDDAVDLICHTLNLEIFQPTEKSINKLKDLALAARVKAALISVKPDIEVSSEDGIVRVKTEAASSQEEHLVKDMKKITKDISGVKEIKIDIRPITPYKSS